MKTDGGAYADWQVFYMYAVTTYCICYLNDRMTEFIIEMQVKKNVFFFLKVVQGNRSNSGDKNHFQAWLTFSRRGKPGQNIGIQSSISGFLSERGLSKAFDLRESQPAKGKTL